MLFFTIFLLMGWSPLRRHSARGWVKLIQMMERVSFKRCYSFSCHRVHLRQRSGQGRHHGPNRQQLTVETVNHHTNRKISSRDLGHLGPCCILWKWKIEWISNTIVRWNVGLPTNCHHGLVIVVCCLTRLFSPSAVLTCFSPHSTWYKCSSLMYV
jgi:hypothetical protein